MILLAVGVLFAGVGISLLLREKGMSLNSDSLAPKPLASSVYVRVPEARFPHQRSISVTSLFPSLLLAPLVTGHVGDPAPRGRGRYPQGPELLGHRHITTTKIYDKRRIAAAEGASHDMPI